MRKRIAASTLALGLIVFGCRIAALNAQVSSGPLVSTPSQVRGNAQMGRAAAIVSPAKSFDEMLTGFEKQMMGVASAMPAEKFDFAPAAAVFAPSQKTEYAGVRSFGAMLIHIAQANYFYGGGLSGLKPDVDVKALSELKDKDQIVAALEASFVFTHKAIATLTPANAFESVRGDTTRASLAGGVVAHGFDHYGQLVEYLRMNAIVPPASVK